MTADWFSYIARECAEFVDSDLIFLSPDHGEEEREEERFGQQRQRSRGVLDKTA